MTRIYITNIASIQKNKSDGGYDIIFYDGRKIHIHKRRTIPALLTLIKHGEGCESDLTNTTDNLKLIKNELSGKIPDNLIQDSYSDANKPFSELWNEEGFVFIKNPPGEKRLGGQKYVLDFSDHEKLFSVSKKARRQPPVKTTQNKILEKQAGKCNFCGSKLKTATNIPHEAFAKDRIRIVWDHRIPVEKGGDSAQYNYQALCFYCNKCKWQICNICTLTAKDCLSCALSYPEKGSIISPTNEDIKDRFNRPF
jgi:HNH endonuclease